MDPTLVAPTMRKPPREPKDAILDVQEFDDHGTARAVFENKTVEVEHGIPGERVHALVHGRRRRWAKIVDIEEASSSRVDAPCPHFHEGCGGCQWQMLDYRSQLERKRQRVDAEFRSAGVGFELSEMFPMEDPWRYRVTAGLSLGYQAGFRRHGSQTIVRLDDCPISHPLIGHLAAHLNQAIEDGRLPNFRGDMVVEAASRHRWNKRLAAYRHRSESRLTGCEHRSDPPPGYDDCEDPRGHRDRLPAPSEPSGAAVRRTIRTHYRGWPGICGQRSHVFPDQHANASPSARHHGEGRIRPVRTMLSSTSMGALDCSVCCRRNVPER